MLTRKLKIALLGATAFAGCVVGGAAQAQTPTTAPNTPQVQPTQPQPTLPPPAADSNAIQDVVVTAARRSESLKEVPAAVTAVSATTLANQRVESLVDLNAVIPSLQVSQNNGDVSFNIRGVGKPVISPAAENSVALNLDGVYVSRPQAAQSALFDIDRVEVVRGPQGTLYGRNATGGAINIISKAPTDTFGGYSSLTGANYGRVDAETVVSGPIVPGTLDGRIGGYVHRRYEGFGENGFDGNPVDDLYEYGFKGALAYTASPKLHVLLRGDYYANDDAYGLYHYAGPVRNTPAPTSPTIAEILGGRSDTDLDSRNTFTNVDNHRKTQAFGASLDTSYKVSDFLELRSITGWRNTRVTYQTDDDGTDLSVADPFHLHAFSQQFSQELQLLYKQGPIDAILGGYYFKEKVTTNYGLGSYLQNVRQFLPPGATGQYEQIGILKTESDAVFLDVRYHLTDRLTLGAGIRYSAETKTNSGFETVFFTPYIPAQGSRDSNGTTPRFTADYKLTDTVNVYASIGRGFKSGEWSPGTIQYASPEFVTAYEAGVRGTLLDRRLAVSAGFSTTTIRTFRFSVSKDPRRSLRTRRAER